MKAGFDCENESMLEENSDLVLLAKVGAPQGLKGELRLKSFSENPLNLGEYGPLCNKECTLWFEIQSLRMQNSKLIAKFKQADDRNQAAKFTGTELYVPRNRLPKTEEDEFYHFDLIGLEVVGVNGDRIGKVVQVGDFGAGDLIEVRPDSGETVFLPFTKEVVPTVDFEKGIIEVDPPSGLLPPL